MATRYLVLIAYSVLIRINEATAVAVVAFRGVCARSVVVRRCRRKVARHIIRATRHFVGVANPVAVTVAQTHSVAAIASNSVHTRTVVFGRRGVVVAGQRVSATGELIVAHAIAVRVLTINTRAVIIGGSSAEIHCIIIGTARDFIGIANTVIVCIRQANTRAIVTRGSIGARAVTIGRLCIVIARIGIQAS